MLTKLIKLSKCIGNTALRELDDEHIELYAKLEYNNFSGSSKDRAAYNIIYRAIESNLVKEETTVIASSSGNLAISLAFICKYLKIKFIPVIDPNINPDNEKILLLTSTEVVKVLEKDEMGGYLLTRIKKVSELCENSGHTFNADQYGDVNNYKGYYTLGEEIFSSFGDRLQYIFIAVSSSGAITGISQYIKEKIPTVKIIGVDIEGSVIFGHPPKQRSISGIGASKIPPIIANAIIDEVIHLTQTEIIQGCYNLLQDQVVFAGASSGAVYAAAKKYFELYSLSEKPVVLLIFPDRGYTYVDTVFNADWINENITSKSI